jgi:hypothetical protein
MSEEEPPGAPGLDPDAAIRRHGGGEGPPSGPDAAIRRHGGGEGPPSDPDAAADSGSDGEPPWVRLEPIIDTSRYQRMIGGFGLALVLAFSIYLFVHGGSGTPGIPAGQPLHKFVAPLATSDLTVDANAHPVCNRARPSRRGLNVCGRRPIVLAFFVLGAKPCVKQVAVLQQISSRFPGVQFAAVAVGGSHAATDRAVRQNHWTIPIAYDQSGILAQAYGVEICPMVEIARGDGVVARRLLGKGWLTDRTLAAVVAKLGI